MRIALCGEPRSGKDTVAEILNSSDNFHRIAFGDYMKDAYYKKYPERENAPKDREHMISFSQPLVEIYNRIWIDWAESELTLCEESGAFDNFVITDLRQPHEEQWCRDNGFHIVRVHSSEIVRVERARNKGEHLGKDLPYWVQSDFHIYNDGSLEDLQSQVDNLLDCLNEIEMKQRRL